MYSTLKTFSFALVTTLALVGSVAAQQPTTSATVVTEPEIKPTPEDVYMDLLQQVHDLIEGDERDKVAKVNEVDRAYRNNPNRLALVREYIDAIKSSSKPSPTSADSNTASTGELIASEALVGHESEYHNPPCGNDAPFNEVTKDGKIIPRCFVPASTSVTVVGKAPKEPNPTKVHVPDPPKTEDPAKVHVQDSTVELDYKKLVEEEMRGLIDESKTPAAIASRNEAMRQAAHKEALARYLKENCGRRGKNEFECGRKRAELSSIANTNQLASYNRKGNMTACVGTPAQIVNGHVVEKLHVEGASMGLLVVNDSDLVWKIDSPSRIHTNGPAGPIAVNLCPHSSFTPNFVLTALFGPGSGYTSSRRSSNEKRQEILLVATSEPLPDGTVLHDEFRFTLDTNGYMTSDSDSWYIGRRVQPSVQFRPTQKSSGTTGSGRRSVGGLFGGDSGTSTEENKSTDEEKPAEPARPRPSVGGLLGGRR